MPRSLRGFLCRYRRDRRGVVSVMGVGALILTLAVAMIVIDTGAMLYARRDLQAATDAAALAAVRQIESAQAAAEAVLSMNNYGGGDAPTVVPGKFTANPALQPNARFDPAADASDFNAVRVEMTAQSDTYFARLFGFGAFTDISATATAAYMKSVSFSAGTRLADLNDGLANQILGGLLGTNISLALIDYNALANADINALAFLDALAIEAGLEAGSDTYGDLLNANVTVGDLIAAAVEVLTGETYEGNPAVARLALETALTSAANNSVPVDALLNAAPFADRTIGSIGAIPGNDLVFNLFDLVSGTAMAVGEGKVVGFNTAVNLAPLASVSGTVKVGEPMAHMAVGGIGDFVRTSQVEVQLNARIDTGLALLLNSQIEVPIHITAAEGMAVVSGIPCTQGGTVTTLAGTTGAVATRYGTANDATPTVATIQLWVPLVGTIPVMELKASGALSTSGGGPTAVGFTQSDIDNDSTKSMSSDVSVLSGLGNALTIQQVTLVSIEIDGLDGLVSTLMSTVSSALTFLDPVVDSLLTTLGVRLGSMDMTVHGVRCNTPVLVL